ncbi:hypothetical protein ABEO75_02095 [Paenibacillus macerans]|uniref:hypothetical protein n=1 Tax=Paenibacillus macerans TaxID=44252 RepID=UPI002E1F0C09|nr:hypothetical protein [Paenibacillus macerans]
MEITYYFNNHFHNREEIENFLLHQVKSIAGSEGNFSFTKQEESEDGEEDDLYVKCPFFSFSTSLYDVNNISRVYDLHINYSLYCSVHTDGEKKFLEFLSNMLKSCSGDALLLMDSEYRVLERKKNVLYVDSHFFNDDHKVLNLSYKLGVYKNFVLRVEGNFAKEEIKLKSLEILEDSENEDKAKVVEDSDDSPGITIIWDNLQVHVIKARTAVNVMCDHIFTSDDVARLKKMLSFFKSVTTRFAGDYQLTRVQGYWRGYRKESVLLERKNGRVTVNGQEEEAYLLHGFNFN